MSSPWGPGASSKMSSSSMVMMSSPLVRTILRAVVDALLEELRPRELERLEPCGERLDLVADVPVEALDRRHAGGDERQRLAVTNDVVAVAQAIREDHPLSNSWRALRSAVRESRESARRHSCLGASSGTEWIDAAWGALVPRGRSHRGNCGRVDALLVVQLGDRGLDSGDAALERRDSILGHGLNVLV